MKFRYYDQVKVTHGFHKGAIGRVREYDEVSKKYKVWFSNLQRPDDWISEGDLEVYVVPKPEPPTLIDSIIFITVALIMTILLGGLLWCAGWILFP